MLLTSLTLRGFKSFADTTTLAVEPGITTVVGPNGSGKSNIVDALAWVLGTAAPTKVRSGQMADVIFAGSPTRSALGQARVEITLDNSEGQLGTDAIGTSGSAQEFTEVSVAREVYASGESSYQINGQEVRALDIQELLSDAGLGRELHTIVGQGELDEILNAKPEERRAHIEEAAGILKHRRRRERASRKLEHVDDHIERLTSILQELRRQLAPLERQAEEASRHAELQAELREQRILLAAHDLAELRERHRRHEQERDRRDQRLQEARDEVETASEAVEQLEERLDELEPQVERAQHTFYRLSSLRERLRGTGELIEARRKHLLEYAEEPLAGRPPDRLRAQARELDEQRADKDQELERARERLDEAVRARIDAEAKRREREAARQARSRRRAEQRERVLRWEGEVSSLRGAIESAETELERIDGRLEDLDERVAGADEGVEHVQQRIQRLDAREVELTEALETARERVDGAEERVETLVDRRRRIDQERSSQAARAEALEAAADEHRGGARALLESDRDGVLGTVADHVRVADGGEAALAAALGRLGEAVVVTTAEEARRCVAWLREHEVGGAVVLPAQRPDGAAGGADGDPIDRQRLRGAGARPAGTLVEPADGDRSERVVASLRDALRRCWVVDEWPRAVRLHGRHPGLAFVTEAGDVAGPGGYVAGDSAESSSVLTATAAAEARERAGELADRLADVERELERARGELEEHREDLRVATERINESDAQITAAAERLARLNKERHAASNQREVVARQRAELEESLADNRRRLARLEERGPDVEDAGAGAEQPDEPDVEAQIQRLEAAAEAARERELERRVACERISERVRHLADQAEELRSEADEVEEALAEAARRRERRRRGIARCGELSALCSSGLRALEDSLEEARSERSAARERLEQHRERLAGAKDRLAGAQERREELREERHEADLRRADAQHELDELDGRIREDFGLSPDEVAEQHPEGGPDDRREVAERVETLTRKLERMGQVNPLALEEYEALEERHRFLSGQLEDLRDSKEDLEEVITAVDDRIRVVFERAFEDVAAEFDRVFDVMFPGGDGRLVLTEPDDMLTTGVEIRARPPGKRISRLSLLSGGERSLTVLAFVFAIFRARPSPFYVLDEVDAALDDVNLQRLLRVIESFRGQSQIILVTHQKRSMEIADVMYGITMGDDAVTKVVTERLGERESLEPALPTPRGPDADGPPGARAAAAADAGADPDTDPDADADVDDAPVPVGTS